MSLVVDIEKTLEAFHLNVQCTVEDEVLALLGPSGCGKSMMLKCIAGIEKPDRGKIILDGRTLFDSEKGICLPPQERHVGMLFQNYALFPNMTVMQNIRAGAKREKNVAKREAMIRNIVESFGLSSLLSRYPHQLSGGQQQRTALARILVSDPDIILLDEPFSALDAHLRFRLEQEVRAVIKKFGKTVVFVSHDRDEVYRISDKIAIIQDGHLEAFGSKIEVFENPKTRNGAILTGCKNISRIEKLDNNHVKASDWGLELATHTLAEDISYVGIRMHDICVGEGENAFAFEVVEELENPFSYTIMLRAVGRTEKECIGWTCDKEVWHGIRGEQIWLRFPRESIALLKE